jgi:hypothetical protein
LRFWVEELKNWRIEESDLTDESGDLLSDTRFFCFARINPGACTLAAFGHWIEELKN